MSRRTISGHAGELRDPRRPSCSSLAYRTSRRNARRGRGGPRRRRERGEVADANATPMRSPRGCDDARGSPARLRARDGDAHLLVRRSDDGEFTMLCARDTPAGGGSHDDGHRSSSRRGEPCPAAPRRREILGRAARRPPEAPGSRTPRRLIPHCRAPVQRSTPGRVARHARAGPHAVVM